MRKTHIWYCYTNYKNIFYFIDVFLFNVAEEYLLF